MTSFKLSKELAKYFGDIRPIPEARAAWYENENGTTRRIYVEDIPAQYQYYFAYEMTDLISKPFCETFGARLAECLQLKSYFAYGLVTTLTPFYYNGGFAAVEEALFELMEDSNRKNN